MLHTLHQMLAPAVMARVTLLLNHVLAAEPVATERLRPHVDKSLRIDAVGWPTMLPPLPALAWRVTPAGLLEWQGDEPNVTSALRLTVTADNPALLVARLLAGEQPAVDVSGDAQFAGDVNWLMQNLRWDIASDLERVFPAPVAVGLQRAGQALAGGLKVAVQGLAALRQRAAPGPSA